MLATVSPLCFAMNESASTTIGQRKSCECEAMITYMYAACRQDQVTSERGDREACAERGGNALVTRSRSLLTGCRHGESFASSDLLIVCVKVQGGSKWVSRSRLSPNWSLKSSAEQYCIAVLLLHVKETSCTTG